MKTFQMVSAQTGNTYGQFVASSEAAAVDAFAQARGFANRAAMWSAGRWEYISAVAVRS